MTLSAGNVTVDTDGSCDKSGMAGQIYDELVQHHDSDTGCTMATMPPAAFIRLKQSYAALANRIAGGVASSLLSSLLTPEQGLTVSLTNKTGAASVKGSLVAPSAVAAEAFALQTQQLNVIGVVYDDAIPDGGTCRVVIAGLADVLLEDGSGATAGDWLGAAATPGRAASAGGLPPPVHFSEIGHSMQTVAGGTKVLCRAMIHLL